MDMDLLIARFTIGWVGEDELVSSAVEALSAGLDSQALRELAGVIPAERDQVRGLFERAVTELGYQLPDRVQATNRVARHLAIEGLAGRQGLVDVASRLAEMARMLGGLSRSAAGRTDPQIDLYVFDHISCEQCFPTKDQSSRDQRDAWIREALEDVLTATEPSEV